MGNKRNKTSLIYFQNQDSIFLQKQLYFEKKCYNLIVGGSSSKPKGQVMLCGAAVLHTQVAHYTLSDTRQPNNLYKVTQCSCALYCLTYLLFLTLSHSHSTAVEDVVSDASRMSMNIDQSDYVIHLNCYYWFNNTVERHGHASTSIYT